MAPTRKTKSVNKRCSSIHEVSPDKDARNSSKTKTKKRLADKLGPQWMKAEIERFYKAYREYGKDWKKVAAAVRNRSTEMVEALYIMNRAYLSLPDGTVSEAGLVAMMIDHYSVLGGSDYERESNKPSEILQNAQKRKRDKVYLESSNEHVFQRQSIASSQGCLAHLRMEGYNGIHSRIAKKRTPRVPFSYSNGRDDTEKYILPNKCVNKSEADDNDDEHVAAWTLTGALRKGDLPDVSQTPIKRTKCQGSSPVHHYNRMLPQLVTTKVKLCDSSNECGMKGRHGCKKPVIGTYARDTDPLMDKEVVCNDNLKGKTAYTKKVKVKEINNNLSADGRGASSGTEERTIGSSLKGKVDVEISCAKTKQLSPCGPRKRSGKKLIFGDESSSIDALMTLADLSMSMLPNSVMESDSSVKLKRDRVKLDSDNSSVPEAASTIHQTDKAKNLGPKENLLSITTRTEEPTSRKLKVGSSSSVDGNVVFETKQQSEPANNSRKRKCEAISLKNTVEEEDNILPQNKCGVQPSQRKSCTVSEGSATNDDPQSAGIDSAVSTSQVFASNAVNLPTKHQNRRKMKLQRAFLSPDKNSSEYTLKDHLNKQSITEDKPKEKLSTCLSSSLARRWCCFEWFYSAIDSAWFAKREFEDYLNHVGLGCIPRLTPVEWGVIRSSLGKPRRFSERFLHEEREKLKLYRESVRKHYTEFRMGTREELPTDLARPISVGQHVIAIHPKTREVHDGKVLTVDHDRCRVQFDSPELGVEFVLDIDCVPLNPSENIPEAFRRNLASDKFSVTPKQSEVNGHSDFGGSMVFTSNRHLDSMTIPLKMPANQMQVDATRNNFPVKEVVPNVNTGHQAVYGQLLPLVHIQRREADIRAMPELNHFLDKKQALFELRNTNDISEKQNGESCLKESEPLKKHSAMASSLDNLRQHNSYPTNLLSDRQKPPTNSSFFGTLASSIDSSLVLPESLSFAGNIVKGSRLKANAMVDAAIKAMSSLKEGEDAYTRIGEALDSIGKWQFTSDIKLPKVASNPVPAGRTQNPELQEGSEEPFPSELITSCVATMLMIQTCTERQYPPADVAQVIESAVKWLHPCCPQNVSIYRDIQRCMNRILYQILALIPA